MSPGIASPIVAIDRVERRRYAPRTMSPSFPESLEPEIGAFRPHPLIRGGHLQTLIPFLFPGTPPLSSAEPRIVPLPDGDALVLHDDQPPQWKAGGAAALLLHGLAGCHLSPYMVRIGRR